MHLPRYGKTRWKGGKRNKGRGVRLISNRVDISLRPKVVDERSRIGDCEGDTVHGQDAHLVTLVDRKIFKRVFSKTKNEVCSAMINMLKSVCAKLTLTLENGGEFDDHERVTEKTGINIFSLNLMLGGSGVHTKIPTVD
jgi:IS30 family transposase